MAVAAALILVRRHYARLAERSDATCRDSRNLLQAADAALLVMEADGSILSMNERARVLFGILDALPSPFAMSDLSVLKEGIEPVFEEYRHRAMSGEPVSLEWDAAAMEGRVIRVEANLRRVEWGGGKRLLATIHDLSRQWALEKERDAIQGRLFQIQKMDALSQLAEGFAHDFNNALTGIMGSLSILKIMNEADAAPDRKEVGGYLASALESGLKAQELTRQLTMISRKEEIRRERLDLRESVSRSLQICSNSFPKSIEIRYREPGAPIVAMGDRALLEQALINVCINAYHAMTIMRAPEEAEGGTLTVSLEESIPDVRMPGLFPVVDLDSRYARIVVMDTGIGMDTESQKRAFEPFFTTKDEHEGLGLGLYIVYGIMKQHGGFIDLRSSPGTGTTVELYLPLPAQDGQKADYPESAIAKGEGTILIIDDESAVRISADGMLKLCGYKTLVAKSGQEGLDIFSAKRPEIALVLLDVSMPGKSGLEVLSEIKAMAPDAAVIMMSGFVENERINQAVSSGASAFLKKPFSLKSLSQTVKSLL
jgi:signal transduction histidine kinase